MTKQTFDEVFAKVNALLDDGVISANDILELVFDHFGNNLEFLNHIICEYGFNSQEIKYDSDTPEDWSDEDLTIERHLDEDD